MKAFLRRRSLIGMGAVISLALPPLRASAQDSSATAPVNALIAGLLGVMKAGRATPFETRMQMLTPVIDSSFNLPAILQASVGPRFASFPPAQQQDLLATFRQFTTASYVANFDAYGGERFEVSPETRQTGKDQVVSTRIINANGADAARLDYVVRANGGPFQIVDVLLDGSISRVAVQRSDFRSLIASGDPAPLITMLHNKVASLAAGDKG